MILKWSYAGQLGSSDYFDVRVWQDGQPANGIANVQQTSYTIGGGFPGGDILSGSVAAIRKQGVALQLSLRRIILSVHLAPAGRWGSKGVCSTQLLM